MGGNVYIVHFTFCGIVYHDGGTVAGKVINAVADHVEGGILDEIDRITANVQAVEAHLIRVVGGV